MSSEFDVRAGFDESDRARVGDLYWAAFGEKLHRAFRTHALARQIVTASLRSDRTVVATADGEVQGVMGFHARGAGAVDITWRLLRAHLSTAGAARALLVLAPLDRRERPGVLVLDGISVAAEARGHGIGSALLGRARTLAHDHDCRWVELSVIDQNPRARALYERLGFRAVHTERLGGWARRIYGFSAATTMRVHCDELVRDTR
ncbi:GNAT family N-acetyltransferase [Microbacterium aquimaris]|uniref:GNAT family N-acetyltransferase n=1 Tax=Microbacterium aquimaris TaxID=459816 RepID=UPI002AD40A61|nr:GNAT family N-acetyltransferase [Microbacterium aquimaris]MDZ8274826.1 GNAT family N-acetyltransferase [Microbacterium aquimaris]